jgi:lantibiotic biosynthesis protein
MSAERWLEVAADLGQRVAREAIWEGGVCTWTVYRQGLGPRGPGLRPADGLVYQGSAGIALFLGELAAATDDPEVARAAVGGVLHALDAGARVPPDRFGFHSGRVGIAWVAARVAECLGRPDLAARGLGLLADMAGHEERDTGLDVILGAAGAIPALLSLAQGRQRRELLRMARRLGDRLLATALREPCGWSWSTTSPAATRNLAGCAHGASGCALALLELARASGDGRYRFAADMALLYERRLVDEKRSNWPDLRHPEINALFHEGGAAAVRDADARGRIPPFRPGFMTAWCHGSPGIGLVRLRAWELTGDPALRREAELALTSTLPSLEPPWQVDQSQCHGVTGNCELPRLAALMWDDEELGAAVAVCAERCREKFHVSGDDWPCGTMDRVRDPSLLLGEAGIGHFYLRLARPEVPSFLLLRPSLAEAAVPSGEADGYGELQEEWLEACFGTTRTAFAAFDRPLPPPPAHSVERSPVEALRDDVRRVLTEAPPALSRLLGDAARVELASFELAAHPYDLSDAFRRRLRRLPPDELERGDRAVVRAADLRLVQVQCDWGGSVAAGGAAEPDASPAIWLVARHGREVRTRRIGLLAAALLEEAAEPLPVRLLVARLAARFDLAGEADAGLAGWVREQVRQLHDAGLLDASVAAEKDGGRMSDSKDAGDRRAVNAAVTRKGSAARDVRRETAGRGIAAPSDTTKKETHP